MLQLHATALMMTHVRWSKRSEVNIISDRRNYTSWGYERSSQGTRQGKKERKKERKEGRKEEREKGREEKENEQVTISDRGVIRKDGIAVKSTVV